MDDRCERRELVCDGNPQCLRDSDCSVRHRGPLHHHYGDGIEGRRGLPPRIRLGPEGELLGFAFVIAGNEVPSIFHLTEAVDWIEREIHEEYAIEFTGRDYEPLLLREDSRPGVYLHEVGK